MTASELADTQAAGGDGPLQKVPSLGSPDVDMQRTTEVQGGGGMVESVGAQNSIDAGCARDCARMITVLRSLASAVLEGRIVGDGIEHAIDKVLAWIGEQMGSVPAEAVTYCESVRQLQAALPVLHSEDGCFASVAQRRRDAWSM